MSNPDSGQFPPFRSALVLVRNLVSVPPPQVFEQDNQVDQGPQTQSSVNKPILHMKPKPREIHFVTYWLQFVAIGTKVHLQFSCYHNVCCRWNLDAL